jgi:hypothetical protein
MTDPSWAAARRLVPDARVLGTLLCLAGLALVSMPALWQGALGLELLAAAFWCWARAAEDRDEQLRRWTWLRRPALGLWLAAGAFEVQRSAVAAGAIPGALATMLIGAQAAGVVWAGLELLAALPLARPFSDRPGPLLSVGPWLPVLIPAAGFVVMWRHVAHWTAVPALRRVALALLILTAVLAALRAFSRGRWVASLRWLIVVDCVIAAILVALAVVPAEVSLLLWLGACAGGTALLAGELRGMAPRRVPTSHLLWRLSGWVSLMALSWPVLVTLGFGPAGISSAAAAIPTAFAAGLAAWVVIRRMVEAPERRAMVRRESAVSLSRVTALLTLAAGPVALVMAWWAGFEAQWPANLLALLPTFGSGLAAWLLEGRGVPAPAPAAVPAAPAPEAAAGRAEAVPAGAPAPATARRGRLPRGAAYTAFRAIVALEQRLVRLVLRLGRGLLSPSRDLHTGDAQEYLLFVIGISLVAILIPLLR